MHKSEEGVAARKAERPSRSMSDGFLQVRLRQNKFDGANGQRPKKLLSNLLKMGETLEGGTVEECEAAHNAFMKDLALYEFSMGKIQVVADTNLREVQAYQELQKMLKGDMERLTGEIDSLKVRVAEERVVRKNKEEYAALAKQARFSFLAVSSFRRLDARWGEPRLGFHLLCRNPPFPPLLAPTGRYCPKVEKKMGECTYFVAAPPSDVTSLT